LQAFILGQYAPEHHLGGARAARVVVRRRSTRSTNMTTENPPSEDMDDVLEWLGKLRYARRLELIEECRTDPLTIQSETELIEMGFYGPPPADNHWNRNETSDPEQES